MLIIKKEIYYMLTNTRQFLMTNNQLKKNILSLQILLEQHNKEYQSLYKFENFYSIRVLSNKKNYQA